MPDRDGRFAQARGGQEASRPSRREGEAVMAISCDWARERLTWERDGELPEVDRAELERHLRGCADCRRERERLEAARALWRRIPSIPSEAGD
ncbi:MAG: hypothetical protein GF328_14110, partial [Candidatus Latescibacteria bacterium]|nr:hypothetical protein [Candidatus Latescibacterota bacterium]